MVTKMIGARCIAVCLGIGLALPAVAGQGGAAGSGSPQGQRVETQTRQQLGPGGPGGIGVRVRTRDRSGLAPGDMAREQKRWQGQRTTPVPPSAPEPVEEEVTSPSVEPEPDSATE